VTVLGASTVSANGAVSIISYLNDEVQLCVAEGQFGTTRVPMCHELPT
jgi:hypothetical protein